MTLTEIVRPIAAPRAHTHSLSRTFSGGFYRPWWCPAIACLVLRSFLRQLSAFRPSICGRITSGREQRRAASATASRSSTPSARGSERYHDRSLALTTSNARHPSSTGGCCISHPLRSQSHRGPSINPSISPIHHLSPSPPLLLSPQRRSSPPRRDDSQRIASLIVSTDQRRASPSRARPFF